MECRNHPGTPASARCAGCAEAFCSHCLVTLGGQTYCGACKVLAVKDQPVFLGEMTPCKEARDAFIISIVGICICAILMEPFALVKASQAKNMISMNPQLSGWGQATAAQIIAIIGLIFWALEVFVRVKGFQGLR